MLETAQNGTSEATIVRGEIEVCDLQAFGLSNSQTKRLKRQILALKQAVGVSITRGYLFVQLDLGELTDIQLRTATDTILKKIERMVYDLSTVSHAPRPRRMRRQARRR